MCNKKAADWPPFELRLVFPECDPSGGRHHGKATDCAGVMYAGGVLCRKGNSEWQEVKPTRARGSINQTSCLAI